MFLDNSLTYCNYTGTTIHHISLRNTILTITVLFRDTIRDLPYSEIASCDINRSEPGYVCYKKEK